jgi:alkanesulfonate monooxygenase SsuD/methylene tetrahydromethanopterin reductase-like flavin-dependent oxidoreductase (luciferase family)
MRIATSNMLTWHEGSTQSQIIREGIERMVFAEKCGFDAAWMTEHHFGNDLTFRPFGTDASNFFAYDLDSDPLTILTSVATQTTRLRLGTGVLVLHLDHPIRVAERAAILDIISNGRLDLGIGRGGEEERQSVAFHVPKGAANRDRFGEAIEILKLAWTGKPFSYDGTYYQVPEVTVTPKPVQDPMPLYVAASKPDSFAWVAERGFPFCFSGGAWGTSGWKKWTEATDTYYAAARRAGVDTTGFRFPQVVFAYCADTDAGAEEVARFHVAQYQRMIAMRGARPENGVPADGSASNPRLQANEATVQDIIDSDIIGSPETCLRKLAAYRAHFKPNYLLLSVGFGNIPHDKIMRSMEMLSRYVLPSVERERELATA